MTPFRRFKENSAKQEIHPNHCHCGYNDQKPKATQQELVQLPLVRVNLFQDQFSKVSFAGTPFLTQMSPGLLLNLGNIQQSQNQNQMGYRKESQPISSAFQFLNPAPSGLASVFNPSWPKYQENFKNEVLLNKTELYRSSLESDSLDEGITPSKNQNALRNIEDFFPKTKVSFEEWANRLY